MNVFARPMGVSGAALIAALLVTAPAGAGVMQTADAGSGAPVDLIQPSLALNPIINVAGTLNTLGEVKYFGGNYAPTGWEEANGQLLPIAQNTALFALLGTTYGGDGQTTFGLPDLRGRTIFGDGNGTQRGQTGGSETTTLTGANLPLHDHTLPAGLGGGTTDPTGSGSPQAFDVRQPWLAMDYQIALSGTFPSQAGSGQTPNPTIGRIQAFAGSNADFSLLHDYAGADGQILSIAQNTALFSIIGFTFGSGFGLPDLRGTAAMGMGDFYGNPPSTWGLEQGQENVTLDASEMPLHDHGLPPSPDSTGLTGGFPYEPESNLLPSLSLRYMVAADGIFPTQGGGVVDPSEVMLGEIGLFAGNFDPSGWIEADGRMLAISQFQALFALFGTTYGGNGVTTFALPDLRGRIAVGDGQGPGLSNWNLGETRGDRDLLLTAANLPAHSHEYFVADVSAPATLGMVGIGLVGLGLAARRRRN